MGDNKDSCGSLACLGGVGSDCSNRWDRPHKHGSNTRVICAGGYQPCNLQVQIDVSGFVSVVHPTAWWSRFKPDSGELFRVRWANNAYPTVAGTACSPPACEVRGSTCLCGVQVSLAPLFTDATQLPLLSDASERLRIGAPPPHAHDAGAYAQAAAAPDGVQLHLPASHPPGAPLDEKAIFGLPVNGTVRYFFNKESTVAIARGAAVTPFSFRNAPHFVSFLEGSATVRDAEHETDAVIDHFFKHANTAPFLCRRMIQRLTTSNPSPRYVAACSAAFNTGTHGGVTYSGR